MEECRKDLRGSSDITVRGGESDGVGEGLVVQLTLQSVQQLTRAWVEIGTPRVNLVTHGWSLMDKESLTNQEVCSTY